MKYNKLITFILAFVLVITSFINIIDATWKIALVVEGNTTPIETQDPVCYNANTNVYYTSLNKAVTSANQHDKIYVIPGSNFQVTSSIDLNNGISIYLPYEGEITKKFSISTVSRKTLITFKNGADLTIGSSSTFEIGAEIGTKGITGSYCEVSLDKESSIIVDGGNLNVYGRVTETNKVIGYDDNTQNVIYDNSLDLGRLICVKAGTLDTVFATSDIDSGSNLLNKVSANICPTYKFQFPCLQTYVFLEYGSYMKAWAYINISGMSEEVQIGIVYPSSDTEKAIFYQVEGSVSIEWCTDNKTIIYINGKTNMGSLYIKSKTTNMAIDSDKMFVPIYQRFSIYVNGTFNTNGKRIKFLPGSFLKILDGSYFNINGTGTSSTTLSKVIFYEKNSLTSLGIKNYGDTDSRCINNGSIVLNNYGALAGYITTEKTDGSACVDLRNVTNSDYLTLSDVEMVSGSATNIPDISLYGPFYDSTNVDNEYKKNSVFTAGVISSSNVGYPYWNGTIKSIETVTLTVLKIEAKSEAFNYTIYENKIDSDSGQKEVIPSNTETRNQSLTFNVGTYIKVIDPISVSITLNDNPYISGTWVLVDQSLDFEITPTKAFTVTCHHTHGQSGAGKVQRSITYASSDSFDNAQSVECKDGSRITANIPEGWYFKVSDNAKVAGTSKVIKTTYDENGNATKTILSETNGELAWNKSTIYVVDGDYEFTSDDVTCLVEGTLITMADGSKKKIEDVKVGDQVMVFNHATGKLDVSFIVANVHEGFAAQEATVINLVFDDGKKTRISFEHGFFDIDKNQYVYINENNYHEMIGRRFYTANGTATKLIDAYVTKEVVRVYSPVTYKHLNLISDDLLSIGGDLRGLFNIFELNDDMTINVEKMNADIELYGLYTYDEWSKYLTKEEFDAFNAKYLKVSIAKGLVTKEEIIRYIESYLR